MKLIKKTMCSKCGNELLIDPTVILTSLPPTPSLYCKACNPKRHERITESQRYLRGWKP